MIQRGHHDTKQHARLEAWLNEKLDDWNELRLLSMSQPQSNGASAATYIAECERTDGGVTRSQRLVIRQESVDDHQLFPDPDFLHTAKVHQALGLRDELQVPRVLGIEPDKAILGSSFCVIEFVEGQVPSDNPPFTLEGWVKQATDQQRTRMTGSALRFLGQLHRIPWRELDQPKLSRAKADELELHADLAYYKNFLAWACDGSPPDIAKRVVDWVEQNMPVTERVGISWGDARYGNIIFRNFELAAALDWEMVSLGDPAKDVGFFSYLNRFFSDGLGLPRMGGVPVGKDVAKIYHLVTGITVPDFDFYEVYASMRSLIILLRHLKIMASQGIDTGGMTPEQNPPATVIRQLIS